MMPIEAAYCVDNMSDENIDALLQESVHVSPNAGTESIYIYITVMQIRQITYHRMDNYSLRNAKDEEFLL